MTKHYDEKELITRIINSDRKAFSLLYSHHLNNLYRYIYLFTKSRETSEEIVQNVFIKIWEHRENLKNINSFKAYIYRCAKNQLLDKIRRNQAETKMFFSIKPDTEESEEKSDNNIIYSQYYQIVQDAIKLLPEKRKRIVELRTQEDLTLDEIAEKLSISKFVVKKQLYAGLHFVREYLQKYGELSSVLIPFLSLFYY
ncbi:RNA polymerase sigma-70 factor (family 1) [Pedobacter sp. CG_S7]|uniref:RNA polymerase sigma factor n=1 Tax=Pedobacter sp. CG_S7 TaxID=3143930 RepID=UPI003396DCCE